MTELEIKKMIDEGKKRRCSCCNNMVFVGEFYLKKNKNLNNYRFNSPCKSCSNKNRNINYQKEYQRKKKYGISQDDYNLMLKNQNYCCDICKLNIKNYNKDFAVDHCHNTGKVRSLLCCNCNTLLGMSKENVYVLKNAIKYIKAHNKII